MGKRLGTKVHTCVPYVSWWETRERLSFRVGNGFETRILKWMEPYVKQGLSITHVPCYIVIDATLDNQ